MIEAQTASFFGPAGLLVLEAEGRDLSGPLAAFKEAGWEKALASLADAKLSAAWRKRYEAFSSSAKRTEASSFKRRPEVPLERIVREIPPLVERLACAIPPNAIEEDPYSVAIPHIVSVVNSAWLYRITEDETGERIELIERLTAKAIETIALHRAYCGWRRKREKSA